MAASVGQILDVLDKIAPPELAESYDNVGLLAGHPEQTVRRILVALDLTEKVVREAQDADAQLIVTHHPIFFRGRKNIREDDSEGAAVCALVRANLSLIAAHTNFDNAPRGVNDALAEALCLRSIEADGHGLRVGQTDAPCLVTEFAAKTERILNTRARLYAPEDRLISRVAVLGGAGGNFFHEALALGADVFVTGEIKHHEALAACAQGLCLIEAGHYETEQISIKLLADSLQNCCNALKYNITVVESRETPFMRRNY